ncbi:heparinase II/III family protein, partial [Acinetobacter baumannii]
FRPSSQAKQWQDTGRYWLENRAKCLIMADGGFSQYSVNYHRVMLDSYCLAEIVRRQFDDKTFSIRLQQQLQRATDWLHV